jgi:hypothetical protein
MALPRSRSSPPPPRAEHLFLPDSLLTTLPSTSQEDGEAGEMYVWGRQKGGARVVVGVVEGQTVEEAQGKLPTCGAVHRGDVILLARLQKKKTDAEGFNPAGWDCFPLLTSTSTSPTSTSAAPRTTTTTPSLPVLFTPLKHLESLSLEPLQLDFQPVSSTATSSRPAIAQTVGSSEVDEKGRTLENAVELVLPLSPSSRSLSAHNPPS